MKTSGKTPIRIVSIVFLAVFWISPWLLRDGIAAIPPSYDEEFNSISTSLLRNTGRAEAVLSLYRLNELQPFIEDPDKLRGVCEKLMKKKSLPLELHHQAAWCMWHEERRTGDSKRIENAAEKLGLMTRWQVIGPFDNDGGMGMDTAFPPESEYDPEKSYPGKLRPVSWRPFPKVNTTHGYQNFKTIMAPDTQSLAYAYGRIWSPRKQRAVAVTSVGGAMKVWVNGKLAIAWEEDRPYKRLQSAYWITLNKGVNSILVKCGGRDNDWGFRLSLLDQRGRPLKRLIGTDDSEAASQKAPFPSAPTEWNLSYSNKPKPFSLALDKLTKRFNKRKSAAGALQIAKLLQKQHPYSKEMKKDEEWVEKALEIDPDYADALLFCGRYHSITNRRLACLRRGNKNHPEDPHFSMYLAQLLASHEELISAKKKLVAIASNPAVDAHVAQLLAALDRDRGWGVEAYHRMKTLHIARPKSLFLLEKIARLAERIGLETEAFDYRNKLLALNGGDLPTLRWLYGYWMDRANIDNALPLLDRIIALAPNQLSNRLQKATVLHGAGKSEEAKAILGDALLIAPENTVIIGRLAELEHEQGNTAQAIQLWQTSLQIRPQNPDLKQYLQYLTNTKEGFEKPYIEDALELVARYPEPKEIQDSAESLLEQSVWRVFDNGLSSRFDQNVIRVNDETGVKRYKTYAVRYSPGRQEVKVLLARIIRKDGTIVEQYEENERSLGGSDSIHYDARLHTVTFQQLAPGDVVEYQVKVNDVAADNLYADYFGAMQLIQGSIPIHNRRLVFLLPSSRELYYNQPRMAPEPAITELNGERIYEWRLEDVPKIEKEPNMPPWVEIADYLHVSTFKDWNAMGRWYWGLVKQQFIAKEGLRKTVAEIIKGVEEPEERIRLIYNWVVSNTRYVGLEFGIHSFKPYQVNDIFERKFGDCKDKATLLITMLKEAGIHARLAIIRTSNIGALADYPPSLSMFNHAIAYVPEFDLWLDGTAEFSGMYELPYQDRRGQVMLVSDEGTEFVRVPASVPASNEYRQTATISLDTEGSGATITNKVSVKGTRASRFRSHFQDTQRREENLEKLINKDHPGAVLESFAFESLTDLNRPIAFTYTASLPDFIHSDSGGYRIRASVDRVDLIKQLASLSKRSYPVAIERLQTLRSRTTIELGERFELAEMPETMQLEKDFARFSFTAKKDGKRLIVNSEIVFSENRIPTERYPEFREFCEHVTRLFNQELRLRHAE